MKYIVALLLLISFNSAFAQSAETILKDAAVKAKAENKKIIVLFHASWCGWCKKMDISMNDPVCKKYFDDNFITVHLTVDESEGKKHLETPGGDLIKKKYKGETAGLPFWLILDADQQLLADSYMRKPGVSKDEAGENIGCPASEPEVAAFIIILQQTTNLKKEELKIIAERFRKNQS
jgi:thiol-disulfide isomerase/thioredoxin